MTTGPEPGPEHRFTPNLLPWLAATGAFVVFALTLNPWVSLFNLVSVARMSGWTWQPEVLTPAYLLVTYPLRWLPAAWIPLALNLFSAACAAWALALLAQSVALLPHDRSEAQRQREHSDFSLLTIRHAWLPAVLAVLICGLQLSFWEQATNGTSEMFDLLLFAYVIRSLLEYRIDERASWLARAAFVYGLGMTDNWAMVGLLPVFIAAVLWIRGARFFSLGFLTKMALSGLAGLSLYLLLPTVAAASGEIQAGSGQTFWQALKFNLAFEWSPLRTIASNPEARHVVGLLSLTSLLPVAVMGVRWASSFGDNSRLGAALAGVMFNLVHGLFLMTCVWVAFDPPFSPRERGLGLLMFYYLGALGAGYYSGYFLLVFGTKPIRPQKTPPWLQLLNRAVVALVWLLLVLAPAGLIYKNAPQILAANKSDVFQRYTARVEEGLPRGGGILLSDDWLRLFLVQASLVRHGEAKDYLLLDTQSMKWPAYQRFLHRKNPRRWTETADLRQPMLADDQILRLVVNASTSTPVCYLHPSFGYYFERFCPEPRGLVIRLHACPTNTLVPPPPAQSVIAENEAFWKRLKDDGANPPPAPDTRVHWIDRLLALAHVSRGTNLNARIVGTFYSQSLDQWGVTMQQVGNLETAAKHFAAALKLNPDNVVARLNLEFNERFRAGQKTSVSLSKSVEDQFGRYRDWNGVIRENGPFDEPAFCYEQGRVYLRNGLYRQAAAAFARVCALSPDNALARIWLARLYVFDRLPDEALRVLKVIQDRPEDFALTFTNRSDFLFVEASAHFERNDVPKAEQAMELALTTYPEDDNLLATVLYLYESHGDFSNALAVINRRLERQPDKAALLVSKAQVASRLGLDGEAILALTHLLARQTNNYNVLSARAAAYMHSNDPEAARQDYAGALEIIERRLKAAPDDPDALISRGYININLGAYAEAITALSHLLLLQPTNRIALFDRAIAGLRSDRLDDARQDYERLEEFFPKSPPIHYGLGEIAWRTKDTNAAVAHYRLYLAYADTNSAESRFVSQRLKALHGGSP